MVTGSAESSLKVLGLSEQKIQETLKNQPLSETLCSIVAEALKITGGTLSGTQGKLLYQVATRLKKQCLKYRTLLVKEICKDRIITDMQLTAALQFLLSHVMVDFEPAQFEAACGIGVRVSPEEIEDVVLEHFHMAEIWNKAAQIEKLIKAKEAEILQMRYSFPVATILGEFHNALCLSQSVGLLVAAMARKELPWADGALLKKETDLQLCTLLGPKTLEEMQGIKKAQDKQVQSGTVKAKTSSSVAMNSSPIPAEEEGANTIEELMRKKANFHKPGENYKTEGYVITPNTMRLLEDHLKATGGKVVTRFPPEPNGILHIGHAKAINIDFGYAKVGIQICKEPITIGAHAQAHGGVCYLRYDDTNPEKEEERYFKAIIDMVEWLGYKPFKVTHSSDYFDRLYELAVELIKRGHAYVCHQKADEIKGYNPPPSPWRDRPIEESLSLFEDMKNGLFDEGGATLRMKVTLEEGKVDPVAYRIKYVPHHRSGNKWCIYPTYDYTHCLCDSIENVTHSLCTKEFQSRRSSYYWLCNVLDLYCPVQWEFGRLNISYTVVSKRKILKGWDDPRLFTLTALRRRGFPPEAVNSFVAKMGLTTAQVTIDPTMLEAHVRDALNLTAPRHMVVIRPLKVTLTCKPADIPTSIEVPNFPQRVDSSDVHVVQFSSVIYIEADDFKEQADKSFKRFTASQSVGLKYVGLVLKLTEAKKDALGNVIELVVSVEKLTEENKPKGFIHWVAKPRKCEVRLYDRLFHHKNPEDSNEVPNGFLSDVNENSLEVLDGVFIDQSLERVAKVYDKFQFERVGYFSVDPDSNDQMLVFNRTVSLREDVRKNTV
ncbi:glutamine--tRNA ligase [Trichuris suis]|nr:glutamine--tRNA ligase [Trichuris suis]